MMTNQEMTIQMLGIVKAMNVRAVFAPGKDNLVMMTQPATE